MSAIARSIILAFLVISFPVLAQEPAPPKELPKTRYCIIVKSYQKKGADAWTRWTVPKPYNYVEGDFPPRLKFRWELNAKHVEQLKKHGGHVVILKSEYTLEELKDAREQCKSFLEKKEQ
jgi:hypothetical protein